MKKLTPQPSDTKRVLLECAEKLFLASGFEGVSVRQITKESGTNVASVNYHFGDKTGLFKEVLANKLDRITNEKLSLLRTLEKQKPAASLEEILTAYIRSFFETQLCSAESDRLMQIIYREMGPDSVTGDLVATRLIVPINQSFKQLIMKACPHLDENSASFCVSSITGQILHFIRSREILRNLQNHKENQSFIEDIITHITQFSLWGLRRIKNA